MNRPNRLLGITLALPAAAALMLSSAAPSLADEDCTAVVLGMGINCSDKGGKSDDTPKPGKPSKSSPTSPSATPSSAPKPSATATTSKPAAAPAPRPTVTIVERTKEVVVTKEVKVTVSTTPSPMAPLGPTMTKPASPTSTAAVPAAAAPSSAPPSNVMTVETIRSAETRKQAGEVGSYLFFIGLAGLSTMTVIAKKKNLFPFEKGNHSS